MPTVAEETQQTVAPQPVPDARQQAPFRMMQMATIGPDNVERGGAQLEQAGNSMLAMAAAQQAHENEMNVKQVDANIMTGGAAILNGDPSNPNDSGYLGKVGADATGGGKLAALQAVQDLAKNQTATLANPAQQQMAATIVQMRLAGLQDTIEKHATTQASVANMAAGQTRLGAAQSVAPSSYNSTPTLDAPADSPLIDPTYDPTNPGVRSSYQDALHTVQSEASSLVDLKYGASIAPDVKAEIVRQQVAATYGATLSHMLDGATKGGTSELSSADLALARNYYGKVKDQFSPEQQDKYTQLLANGATKTQSLDTSLLLQQQHPNDLDGQMKALDTLYQGGKMDVNVYHATMTNLTSRESADRAAQSEQDKTFLGNVWNVSQQPGSSMSSLSPSQMAYVQQRNLGKAVEAMFDHTSTTDNPRLFMDTMNMPDAELVKMGSGGIAALRGQVSSSNFAAIENRFLGINKNDVIQQTSDKLMMSTIKDATNQLHAAGLNTTPKADDTDGQTRLAQFQTDLRTQLVTAQKLKGSPLTPDEAKTVAMQEVKTQALAKTGIFFDDEKAVYRMTPEERAQAWVVPGTERPGIVSSLQKKNLPVTEANIQAIYKIGKKQ